MSQSLINTSSYVRLLDASGNSINSSSNALDINVTTDVKSAVYDNFNCNANMQIADTDLTFGQAVMNASLPVVIASDQSAINVTNATASDFNCNATMQISGSDLALGQAVMASSIPVTIASDQSAINVSLSGMPYNTAVLYASGSSGASLIGGSTSASFDTNNCSQVAIFGNIGTGTGTLTIQTSIDNSVFYNSNLTVSVAAGNFYLKFDCPARYIQIVNNNAITAIDLVVSCKA